MRRAIVFLAIANIISIISILKEKDEIMEIRRQQIIRESRIRRYLDNILEKEHDGLWSQMKSMDNIQFLEQIKKQDPADIDLIDT